MAIITVLTNTDVDIDFNVEGITVPTLTEVVVDIINTVNQTVKQYKYSLSQITLASGVITLLISKTDFTATGDYAIRVRVTEPDGKVRGIKLLDYDQIKFI